MVTPYGDYIAFRDADSWGDYAIATAGVLPFVKYIKVAGKVVKVETKAAQTLVKDAEAAYKAGNVAEGNRLMNQVASQSSTVETTVVKESNNSSKMTLIQDSQASSGVTKPTDTGKTTDIKSKGKQKDDTIWTETKERTSVEKPMNIGINIKAIFLNIKMQNNMLMQLIILLEVRQKEL